MKKRHLLLLGTTFLSTASLAASSFTPQQTKDIQNIIREYLINHPNVLVAAAQSLQTKMQQQAESKALKGIKANKLQLFKDPNSPVAGNPNASVLVAEFFDYQCGHCKAVASLVKQVLKKDKDVKFIFKELPIFGGNSTYAAQAALASVKQGKYLELHNLFFAINGPLDKQIIMNTAKKAGVNINKLSADLNNPDYKKQIRDNFRLMQAIGITGTPAFVIANKSLTKFQYIPGAPNLQTLQDAINAVRS